MARKGCWAFCFWRFKSEERGIPKMFSMNERELKNKKSRKKGHKKSHK